jgi:hypothetical protein
VQSHDHRLNGVGCVNDPPILFFELFHTRHKGYIHAAEIRTTLVEDRLAKAAAAANFLDEHASSSFFEESEYLFIGKFRTYFYYVGTAGKGEVKSSPINFYQIILSHK